MWPWERGDDAGALAAVNIDAAARAIPSAVVLPDPPGEPEHRDPGPVSRPARPAWTTPVRVRVLAGICLGASVMVLVVTMLAVAGVRSGLSVIGHRTAPEVVDSSGVYFALNDMDAQVANALLVGNQSGLGLTLAQTQAIYQQDRQTVDKDLQQTAIAAASDRVTQQPIGAVLDGLGQYEALAAEAVLLESQGTSPPGRPPAPALSLFRQATDLMHATILPASQELTSTNAATLD